MWYSTDSRAAPRGSLSRCHSTEQPPHATRVRPQSWWLSTQGILSQMCCGVSARRRQVSTQAQSVFYFPWGKLEAAALAFAPVLVGLAALGAHAVFDPYRADPTFKPSFILVVPFASFAHVPARILHQSAFALQTSIAASRFPSSPRTEMATHHQHSFAQVAISCQSSSILDLQMFLLDSVGEALPISGSARVNLVLLESCSRCSFCRKDC